MVYLLKNRERVVSKDDLVREVWGGRIVSNSTLPSRINAVRKAVGDDGRAQQLIRTVPRKGIRFVGVVREEVASVAPISVEPTPSPPPALVDEPSIRLASGERRQLTVVSCDLGEATALASRLDPEDLRDLITQKLRGVGEIAARFDGVIAPQSGDGISIYFGYPRAHEDNAERAIRCALALAAGPAPASLQAWRSSKAVRRMSASWARQ